MWVASRKPIILCSCKKYRINLLSEISRTLYHTRFVNCKFKLKYGCIMRQNTIEYEYHLCDESALVLCLRKCIYDDDVI